MAENTELQKIGLDTIAKYTLDANIGTEVNIKDVSHWELTATGASGTDTITKDDSYKWTEDVNGNIVVFIDTIVTGKQKVVGRVSMLVDDSDYPGKIVDGEVQNVGKRPEVTIPFDMFIVE